MSYSSSNGSKSFFIQNYYSRKIIKKVEAFQKDGSGFIMTILTAKHCFALITLEDDTCILVEAGFQQNSKGVAISFQKISRSQYDKYERIDYTVDLRSQGKKLSELIDFLKNKYRGTDYDAANNNCYDAIQWVMLFFNKTSEQKKIQIENNKQVNKGIRSVTGTGMAISGAIYGSTFGPVGTVLGATGGFISGKIVGLFMGRKTS